MKLTRNNLMKAQKRILYFKTVKLFLHLIIIFLLSFSVNSQNIFDIEHSEIYADHLFQNKEFKEAVFEYERLIQKVPDCIRYKERLLLSYKYSEQIVSGIQKTEELFPDFSNISSKIIDNYLQMLFINNDFEKCDSLFDFQLYLRNEEYHEYKFAYYLLTKQYDSLDVLILSTDNLKIEKSRKYNELLNIYTESKDLQNKKPIVSAVLSVIIPGSGKAYANDFNNGALVFSIIGLYGWQSYRAFSNDGIKSVYGWVFGTLAAGFYLGNIYGSYQSAERENIYQDELINKKVKNIILKDD